MTISKSPERHTFQSDNYIKRCEEEGKEPSEDYLELYKSARQRDEENMVDPKWQKDNMVRRNNIFRRIHYKFFKKYNKKNKYFGLC